MIGLFYWAVIAGPPLGLILYVVFHWQRTKRRIHIVEYHARWRDAMERAHGDVPHINHGENWR